MMSAADVAVVLGTAATVAVSMAAAGKFVLRSVIREDVAPIRETMALLAQRVGTLTATLEKEQDGLRDNLKAINDMLANHETRITLLEQTPPRPVMRAARKAG